MCKMTSLFDEEPTERCDGCDKSFPESELKHCGTRYVDEDTEWFKFCPDCLKVDMAYETYLPESY